MRCEWTSADKRGIRLVLPKLNVNPIVISGSKNSGKPVPAELLHLLFSEPDTLRIFFMNLWHGSRAGDWT